MIIFIVAIVLMILAPIFAQFIYFAISRKREYLADASSALYTRYPEGLASALEKIGASTYQLKSASKATAPMYIINPFRKEGVAASDLTSTHPPISERIRILRSMAGSAYSDYDSSYRQMHKTGSGVISASEIAAVGAVSIRAATPMVKEKEPLEGQIQRTRETSNLMWQLNNYRTIDCECGTRLRVPPSLRNVSIRCPHCGRMYSV